MQRWNHPQAASSPSLISSTSVCIFSKASLWFFKSIYLLGCAKSSLQNMRSSSQTRYQTGVPCIGSSLSHWTTNRGSPNSWLFLDEVVIRGCYQMR